MSRRLVTPLLLATASCLALTGVANADPGYTFRVIGQLGVPGQTTIDGVRFGGLSGVDFDAATGTWRAISDDRSDLGPARFYHLRLGVSANSLDGGISAGVTNLLRADGTPYPPSATAGADTVEPEAIRFDPRSGNVIWANSGERQLTPQVLVDTAIRETATGGAFVRQLAVPGRMKVSTAETGIRARQGISGLTVSPSGSSLVSVVAAPLLQDGPLATATVGAFTRLTLQSRSLGGAVTAQYAYPLDKVPAGFATNEAAEILAVADQKYLVLERAHSDDGRNSLRLFEIDLTGATNIAGVNALAGATYTAVSKRQLVDFRDLRIGAVANFQGITWGPSLPNGDRTLVLVSDNDFDPRIPTRLLALAMS
jgi:3-phytase